MSTRLQRFQGRVDQDPELRSCVLGASYFDDTLVVYCGCIGEMSAVELMLSRHWDGKIEVYRLSELAVGSVVRDDDEISTMRSKSLN